jgi:hypothetical protein
MKTNISTHFTSKIPKKHWNWVYDQHLKGLQVSTIQEQLKVQFQVCVFPATIYHLLENIDKNIGSPCLVSHISDNIEKTFENLQELHQDLKDKLLDAKFSNTNEYLRIADRLLKIYSLQLASTAFNKQFEAAQIDHTGKEQFMAAISNIVEAAKNKPQ